MKRLLIDFVLVASVLTYAYYEKQEYRKQVETEITAKNCSNVQTRLLNGYVYVKVPGGWQKVK